MSESENETLRRAAAKASPLPNSFGPRTTRILIRPASYQKPYRMEASAKATEMGMGLLMELHSSSTHFYADPEIPVGKVDIWAPPAYKEMPQYVTTLDSAEDDWETENDRITREWVENQAQSLMREATEAAEVEYPITDELTITERSVKLVLREGFIKGFLRGRK
ncbi:hypothetical protein SEA_MAGRITTE_198 [Microbacterium phage Magritte]|nr:hypothetical protein SEA_MAGRITTE_198 [Microbacterium phage Magritte]